MLKTAPTSVVTQFLFTPNLQSRFVIHSNHMSKLFPLFTIYHITVIIFYQCSPCFIFMPQSLCLFSQLLPTIGFFSPDISCSDFCLSSSGFTWLANFSSVFAATPEHDAYIEISSDIYATCTVDQIAVSITLPCIQQPFLTSLRNCFLIEWTKLRVYF